MYSYAFNNTLFSLFYFQIKEKVIEFTMDNRVIHSDVLYDDTKLWEIFLNILSNFLEYTLPNRKDSMNLKEIPSHWPGYAMCQTVIEDICIGMSEERLSHLFKKFARELSCTEK